ncbi:MAG TPA: efflux RND transporter periplasmic adaptor subunit [Tepidisphaeraceae bacterium]|nr:efflux RND transporter periplasmic adaptor subunit [Tepidisphaeraceae bacterium]
MKTLLTVVITVAVVGSLAGTGMWIKARKQKPEADAVAVRVETVQRGRLVEVVASPGEIQPRTKVSISAKVSSRIIELPFKEGESVRQGDVLVRLDSSDLEAILRSAQARYAAQQANIQVAQARVEAQRSQLAGLRAALAEANRDLDRQRGLLATKDVSQAVVDAAQRRVDEAQAAYDAAQHSLRADEANLLVLQHQLEAADAEIARAREDLSYTTITSPIDGVVTVINAKVGELVVTGTMNNPGTVIMEVADLSKMLVQARVDETDVANVQVGQTARCYVQAYPDRVFSGKVVAVALARTVERGGGQMRFDDAKTFKVEILLETGPQERIYSGLTADVEIETRTHSDVLKVPSQCVLGRPTDELPQAIRDNNPCVDKTKTTTTVVYRFIDGKAVVTPVIVGPSDISHTLIRAGLSDGDRIITGPYKVLERLAHDQRVKQEARPATQPGTQPATQPS